MQKPRRVSIVILFIFFLSCKEQDSNDYKNLPHILNGQIPSLTEDMFLNLMVDSSNLPNNCNYIVQTKGEDTLNIIEFDDKKRMIFKSYRQFVFGNWNGKYLTMIEGHIYENNILKKTYYLHSNCGFKFYKYFYKNKKISNIKEYELNLRDEVNTNPYDYINHIFNINQLIKFTEKIGLDKKSKQISETKREYLKSIVQEYFKRKKTDTFSFSNTFLFDNETKNLIYTKYPNQLLRYNSKNKLSSKISKEIYQEDYYTTKFENIQNSLLVTTLYNGKPFMYRVFKNKNVIYLKYIRNSDSTNFEERKFELDDNNFPKRVIIKDFDKKDTINLTTRYLKNYK